MWPHTLHHTYLRPEYDPSIASGAWTNQINHGRPVPFTPPEQLQPWPVSPPQQYYPYAINGTHSTLHGQSDYSASTQWKSVQPTTPSWTDTSRQTSQFSLQGSIETTNYLSNSNAAITHYSGRESQRQVFQNEIASRRQQHSDNEKQAQTASAMRDQRFMQDQITRTESAEVESNGSIPNQNQRPKPPDPFFDFCPGLGAFVKEDSNGEACVDYILPGGAFDNVGVQVGDILLEIEGSPVLAARDVVNAGKKWQENASRPKKSNISLVIKRHSEGHGFVCKSLGPTAEKNKQNLPAGSIVKNDIAAQNASDNAQTPRQNAIDPKSKTSQHQTAKVANEGDDVRNLHRSDKSQHTRTYEEIVEKARKTISDDIMEKARKSLDYSAAERAGEPKWIKSLKVLEKRDTQPGTISAQLQSVQGESVIESQQKGPALANLEKVTETLQNQDLSTVNISAREISKSEKIAGDSSSKNVLDSEFHREMGKLLVEKHKKAAEEHSSAARAALYQEAKEWAKMELERRKAKSAQEAKERQAQADERTPDGVTRPDFGTHMNLHTQSRSDERQTLQRNLLQQNSAAINFRSPMEVLRAVTAPPDSRMVSNQGHDNGKESKDFDTGDRAVATSAKDDSRLVAEGTEQQLLAKTRHLNVEHTDSTNEKIVSREPQRTEVSALAVLKEKREKVEELVDKRIQDLLERRALDIEKRAHGLLQRNIIPNPQENIPVVTDDASNKQPAEIKDQSPQDKEQISSQKEVQSDPETVLQRFEAEFKTITDIDWSAWGVATIDSDAPSVASDHQMSPDVGVGLSIERLSNSGMYQVIRIAPDGTAFGKMKIRDTIISIDGVEVSCMSEEEATSRFRGPEGSTLTLVVDRKLPWPYLVKERHVVHLTRGSGKSAIDERSGAEDADLAKGAGVSHQKSELYEKLGRLFVKPEDLVMVASYTGSRKNPVFLSDNMLCGDLMITIISEGWTQASLDSEGAFRDLHHH